MVRPFDPCHLIGVYGAVAFDRNIFAGYEAFVAEMEADLVVAIAFGIVEIPLSAGLAPQPADQVFFTGAKTANAAGSPVRFPFFRIDPALARQWSEHVIALFAMPARAVLLAGKQQPDMPEFRVKILQIGHGELL